MTRLWQYAPPVSAPVSTRLGALRRTFYDEALDFVSARGRLVRVATYVATDPAVSAEPQHDALTTYAEQVMGWRLGAQRFTDHVRRDEHACTRPELSRACQYAGTGRVDGILTAGRASLPSDDVYEVYLRWLHDRLAFIAFSQISSSP
ncbi:hypothetical protein [Streptomyces sp. NPDC087294]|uniref:hypothetical protein n=1 Tax=Streptomyces sp. NPDC087294 TaxID=3365777 RepID=UPI0037F13C8F